MTRPGREDMYKGHIPMYDKIHKYRFVMQNGRELIGKVIAQDGIKLIITTGDGQPAAQRTILYHHSIIMAEQMGWKCAQSAAQ